MPVKSSVIFDDRMYDVLREAMHREKVKRDGEYIRRVLARDPIMQEEARKQGINLDEMVVTAVGGYRGRNTTE